MGASLWGFAKYLGSSIHLLCCRASLLSFTMGLQRPLGLQYRGFAMVLCKAFRYSAMMLQECSGAFAMGICEASR